MQRLLRWYGLFFERIFSSLLILYLISTILLEFPWYPAWNHRLQPPELIFGFAIMVLIGEIVSRKNKISIIWNGLDVAVGVYLLINFISAWVHPEGNSGLEVLGRTYLAGVYFLFRWALCQQWLSWNTIITAIQSMASILILTTALGYTLLGFGWENIFLVKFTDYPYFGTVYRAKGFLQTPSMFISVVNWCFLFLLVDGYYTNYTIRKGLLLAGLGICAMLSFSKAALLTGFVILMMVIYHYFQRNAKILAAIAFSISLIIYLGITNFVFLSNHQEVPVSGTFLGIEDLPTATSSIWVPSSYFPLKQAAVLMGNSHPFFGVGPGNFNAHLQHFQQLGIFPRHLPLYDPHSVWFGAFAETGALGALTVMALVMLAFYGLRLLRKDDPFRIFGLIWLLLFSIEGFNGDLMNFRHYWVMFGLMGGVIAFRKIESHRTRCVVS